MGRERFSWCRSTKHQIGIGNLRRGSSQDLSDESLRTLVAQIHTSVGQTIEAHPEKELLDALKKGAEEVASASLA